MKQKQDINQTNNHVGKSKEWMAQKDLIQIKMKVYFQPQRNMKWIFPGDIFFSEQRNIFLKKNVRIEHFLKISLLDFFYYSQIIPNLKKKLNKLSQKQ